MTSESPPLSAPRLIARSAVVLLVVGTWWLTLAPVAVGGPLTMVLVNGSSMQPTYQTGDLVIGYRQPEPVQPGQVAVFRGPDDKGIVIHRVSAVDGNQITTRGDNLPSDDPWDTTVDDVVGTARIHFPGVGTKMVELGQPAVLGTLAALLVVLLVAGRHRDDVPPEDVVVAEVGQTGTVARPQAGWAMIALAVAAGLVMATSSAVLVGRAASLDVTAGNLAAYEFNGPFETYRGCAGNSGGQGQGNNCNK